MTGFILRDTMFGDAISIVVADSFEEAKDLVMHERKLIDDENLFTEVENQEFKDSLEIVHAFPLNKKTSITISGD